MTLATSRGFDDNEEMVEALVGIGSGCKFGVEFAQVSQRYSGKLVSQQR